MTRKAILILLYLTSEVILETCRDRNRSILSKAQADRQECMVKKTMKTWRKANKGLFGKNKIKVYGWSCFKAKNL